MSTKSSIANAVGGKTARACDSCFRKRARWYCAADDAFLCQSCDSVHSANPLARRHQRLRLNSPTSSDSKPPSPSWVSGFTRKPRTPRPPPRPKSDDLLSNPSFSLVPEADDATSHEDNEEDHLLYRVPTFDPFLPSDDLDLADFAADLERQCFDMEGLGLVKVEDLHEQQEADYCRAQHQFEAQMDLMREPFELIPVVDVKNERQEDCAEETEDESKTQRKRRVTLRLDCEAVIAAWGDDKSPWTTGERPDLDPDQPWPHFMAFCEVRNRQGCGEYGMSTVAMGDGGREARVSRYREKRRTRLFSKKIRYEVRKLNAEKRPRMKGRFVKRTAFTHPVLPIVSIK
ncbi:zinc finger protein CONSTANS-LIKE 16-like [Cucurbita pepo subsp. pepo]|uniref:zinc finger protein CONSTANS-LIKE 16-like n=1 Tax=Cucurbita pepo subsp. pepo TaxID=3664 RepID=UPI000C9D873D|nr:zinc finger protein CONSTANS-LIKE 16-like [Cucurbita pepo subsp. pepo]